MACNQPFMYAPVREEVFLNEQGFFQHVECPVSAPGGVGGVKKQALPHF